MHRLLELWHQLYNLEALIRWGGYAVLTAVVFAETGLLVGFFLPGDSLLVTAGLLSSQGFLNVYVMGVILSIAAIRRRQRRLFDRTRDRTTHFHA